MLWQVVGHPQNRPEGALLGAKNIQPEEQLESSGFLLIQAEHIADLQQHLDVNAPTGKTATVVRVCMAD